MNHSRFLGLFATALLSPAVFGLLLAATPPKPEAAVVWTAAGEAPWGVPVPSGNPELRPLPSGGAAWQFNGVDQALVFSANPIEGLAAFTIEVLFRPDRDGAEEQRFFHVQDERERRVLLETRVDRAAGTWSLDTHLWTNPRTRHTLLDRQLTHRVEVWHWVALTYDGKTMRHYVNGEFELEGAIDFPPTWPGRFSLGMRLNQVSPFKGSVSKIRISPRALAAAELQRP